MTTVPAIWKTYNSGVQRVMRDWGQKGHWVNFFGPSSNGWQAKKGRQVNVGGPIWPMPGAIAPLCMLLIKYTTYALSSTD